MNALAHWNWHRELEPLQNRLSSLFKRAQPPRPEGQEVTDERIQLGRLLGVNLEGNQLRLTPNLPGTWSTCTLHYRYRKTPYHIRIIRLPGTSPGGRRLSLDGRALAGNMFSLLDDQRDHSVELQVN